MPTIQQKEFIERVGKLAAADMRTSGVLASLTIAQAILESGWGKSGLTVKANALFGIKAGSSWKGKVYSATTNECYDGLSFVTVTALFRAYGSWEESVTDHSSLLTGAARYKDVIGEKEYKKACVKIKDAGYATDPAYSDKLINLIEAYELYTYDFTDDILQTDSKKNTSDMAVILFNGHEIEVERIFMNGSNYIKLRELEKLGLTVDYDADRKMPVVRGLHR